MALSRIGAASVQAAPITIPTGHRVGDLMVIFAYRTTTTSPTIPAGWTSITSVASTTASDAIGYKIAASSAETSGTWTNATLLACLVYRGQVTSGSPFGTVATGANIADPVNYPARALTNSNVIGSSWYIAFAGISTQLSTLETPPAGMSLATNTAGTASEVSGFDTNGLATANWPSTNVTVGQSGTQWQSVVLELKAQGLVLNDYMSIRVGDGMSVGEKIK